MHGPTTTSVAVLNDYLDTRITLTHVEGARVRFWSVVLAPSAIAHLDLLWLFEFDLIVSPVAFPLGSLVDAQVGRAFAHFPSLPPPHTIHDTERVSMYLCVCERESATGSELRILRCR